MRTKAALVRVKAGEEDGLGDGTFEALVSIFGNIDAYGDKVMPGAFTHTLADWKDSGDPIPVLWAHQMSDPDSHIGIAVEAMERPEGLWVKGQLDMDSPRARQVFKLLKGRRVTQFSFSYDVLEGAWVDEVGEDGQRKSFYELRKLKLYEVGPCLIGANQETELLDAKSVEALAHRVKAGRVLSAANEAAIDTAIGKISAGVTDLKGVLSAAQGDDGKAVTPPATTDSGAANSAGTTDEVKATSGQQEASASPDGAASVTPARPAPSAVSALRLIELAAIAS